MLETVEIVVSDPHHVYDLINRLRQFDWDHHILVRWRDDAGDQCERIRAREDED